MKKFEFSLEKVLTLKQQMLDVEINELSIMQASLYEMIEEIQRLNAVFEEYSAKIRAEFQVGVTATRVLTYKAYLSSINEQSRRWMARKEEKEREIEDKQSAVVKMKSDVSIIEKLKEKKLFEYRQSIQKMQELAIEEYISQKCSVGY